MSKIFNLDNGVVNVYELIPNKSKLIKYRKSEIEKIPEEDRVLNRRDDVNLFTRKKDFIVINEVYGLKKENPKNREYVELNKKLVDYYISGGFAGSRVRVDDGYKSHKDIYTMNINDHIWKKYIQLTKRLYLLELLENGEYSNEELLESDISNLSELFEVENNNPIARLDFKTLVCYHNSGLLKNTFDSNMELIEDSSKVYKKLRN